VADALFDVEELERNASELRHAFDAADPFPHLVVDNLLRLPPAAASAFPDISWPWWKAMPFTYMQNKHTCDDLDLIPEPFKALIRELSEPRFLRVLEQITGITQLLPDPYLVGGGLHLSGPGGILSPHTDFHYYRAMNLYRRINVIVYLNDGWSLQDGGCLSLYDKQHRVGKTVVPDWGRVFIFRTDDQSVHGLPVPVAEGKWRRSVALFYYTAADTANFSGDETTYWREHGEQTSVVKKARLRVYHGLLTVSRVISVWAHFVNPNTHMGLFIRRRAEDAPTETS
jgi:hypothetical protein